MKEKAIWCVLALMLFPFSLLPVNAEQPNVDVRSNAPSPVDNEEAEAEALRLNQQVGELVERNRLAEAIPLAIRSLELSKQVHGPAHPNVAADLITLANLYRAQGDYFNAEPLIREAIEVDKQLYGVDHPEVAVDIGSLALLQAASGENEAAERSYEEAFTILYAKPLDGRHLMNIAAMFQGYAQLLRSRGDYDGAMTKYLNAEQILEIVDPDRAANILTEMADLDRDHGNHKRAKVWLDRARQLQGN